jgi:hypothetical protein
MTRVAAILLLLALAIGLGYLAVVAPEAPSALFLDLAFVLSVFGFLMLSVSELGVNLRRMHHAGQGGRQAAPSHERLSRVDSSARVPAMRQPMRRAPADSQGSKQ